MPVRHGKLVAIRWRIRAAGASALAGALIGEALLLQGVWPQLWAQRVLALELASGILIAFTLSKGRRLASLILSAAAAGVFALAESTVRDTLRAAGWAGA